MRGAPLDMKTKAKGRLEGRSLVKVEIKNFVTVGDNSPGETENF